MTDTTDRESVEWLAYELDQPKSALRPTLTIARRGADTLRALLTRAEQAEAKYSITERTLDWTEDRAKEYRARAVDAEAERDALREKLEVAHREILNASLFAAELAESIGPSDEWSHDFKEGYVFGGRDAARTIRQKCVTPATARIRENERLRDALRETTALLEKDARDMATAFGATDWRKTAPHTAEVVSRARAALQTDTDTRASIDRATLATLDQPKEQDDEQ